VTNASISGDSLSCVVPSLTVCEVVFWGVILQQPLADGSSGRYSSQFRPDLMLPFGTFTTPTTSSFGVYAPPPVLYFCRFNADGSSIITKFTQAVRVLDVNNNYARLYNAFAYNCSVAFITNGTNGTSVLSRPGQDSD